MADLAAPTLPRSTLSTAVLPHWPSVAGYEILSELGHGGMGIVYKARHLRLKRLVALKMISAATYADPRVVARFRTEMEAVAHLQHPNIVQIYEVGEQDGRPFCALGARPPLLWSSLPTQFATPPVLVKGSSFWVSAR